LKWLSKKPSRRKILALLSAGALGALAILGGGVYFVGSPEFEAMAAGYTVRLIESRSGTTASLESFDVDFWGRRIALNGLRLRGEEGPSESPLIAIERIEIGFRLRSLLKRQIDLWSLRVVRPAISLRIGESGSTNVPAPPPRDEDGGRSVPFDVAVGDFVLSGGELRVNESRVDIDFELSDVEGLFAWDEGPRILSGSLSYSGAIERAIDQPIPYRLETDFDYTRGTVLLRPAVITSGETRLSLQGRIDDFLGSRTGSLVYGGVVDLPFLNYFLPDTRFTGTSEVAGSLRFSTREFSTEGRATSTRLTVDDWEATDFESDFAYAFPERTVVATNLDTDFAGGEARGSVNISPLPGSPVIEVDLTYENIDPQFFDDLFPWGADYVRGSAAAGTLRGWLRGGFDDFDLEGDLTLVPGGPDVRSAPPSVTGSTAFRGRPGAIEVEGLAAEFGRTRAQANGLISSEVLSLDAVLDSADLSELAFLYRGLPRGISPGPGDSGRFAGRISGSMADPVFDGDFTAIVGNTRAEASGRISSASLALDAVVVSADLRDLALLHEGIYGSGRFEGQVSGSIGEPALAGDFLASLGSTAIEARGQISAPSLGLDVVVVSEDLGDLAFLYPDANGSGRIAGRIAGSVAEPTFAGDVALSGLRYQDWRFDLIEGGIAAAIGEFRLTDVRVVEGASEIRVDGSYAPDGGRTDLDVAIGQLDARALEPLIARPIGGLISGQVHLTSLDPIEMEGRVEIGELSYEGHPIGRASGDVAYGPAGVDLSDLRIVRDESEVSGTVRYDRSLDEIDLGLAFSGQRLEEYHWIGIPDMIEGRVREAELAVTGSTLEPRIAGQVVLEDFRFGRQSFPEASIDVQTAGRVLGAVVETGERLDLEVDFDISNDGYPFVGGARFSDFDAGQLAGLDEGILIASGNASFDGSVQDLGSLQGRGQVASLTASFGERTLEVTRPFDFEFNTREVVVSPVQLVGIAGTSLDIEGTIAIEAGAPLSLIVYGPIDLSLVGSRYEGLNLSGDVTLDAVIEGTVSDPLVVGIATLGDVEVGHDDVFLDLSGLRGDIFLDGSRASLVGIRGQMSGGGVTLNGTFGFGGGAQGVMDIRVDALNVRPRPLRGLRAVFDGAFGLRGSVDAPILEGSVQLRSMSFGESFEEFLALFDRGPEAPADEGLPGSIALAVHVEGSRNIRVDNELVSLESRLDLDIGGTLGSPSLTGHTEISRGTLTLLGRRYTITRGNVDFVDPVGIDPRIDIQAEADIRDYRVSLLFTGQGDDIQMTPRSDPALPEIEILSLIAGGRTIGELDEEARRRGDPQSGASEDLLFQGVASNVLADMLRSRVGSRLGVLNSVRIDPFLVGATNDPVARLTVSEQITSDLEVTYSQDLASNSQQIIQIEYFLNGDTSFIASRDELGRLGLDIKLRKRFD